MAGATDVWGLSSQDIFHQNTLSGDIIKAIHANGDRFATLGGIISYSTSKEKPLERTLRGLTIGHVYYPATARYGVAHLNRDVFDNDSDEEDFAGSGGNTTFELDLGRDDDLSNVRSRVDEETYLAEREYSSTADWVKKGRACENSYYVPEPHPNLDWALIELLDE